MVRRGAIGWAAVLVATCSGAALADRHHLGWCMGVGNPHQSAYCGSGPSLPQRPAVTGGTPDLTDQTPVSIPVPKPVVTQLPQTPQPQVPQQMVAGSMQPGPGDVTGPFGSGPLTLPPPVLLVPQQVAPQPMPVVPGQVPPVTALMQPPLPFVSHQIVVGTVTVPQVVVNASGQPAQVMPGQIVLKPIPKPLLRPGPAGGAQPRPPALTPALPLGGAVPQVVPGAQVPGALLVPVLSPSLPGGGPTVPQAVPGGQIPTQILVPVLQPSLPGGGGPVPQGVPNPQGTGQILVPVLQPSLPGGGGPVPQGVPNPQGTGAQQSPPLRPPLVGQVRPPAVMGVVVFTRPKPRPVQVPPTTVLQPVVTHVPSVTKPPVGTDHVTSQPGRQDAGQSPAFADPGGGGNWNCVASGHGPRAVLKGGRWITTGVERHVGNVDALGRDVPAKHPKHPHCIISIQRRDGGQ